MRGIAADDRVRRDVIGGGDVVVLRESNCFGVRESHTHTRARAPAHTHREIDRDRDIDRDRRTREIDP